jgi:pimeloyl-ACP methyl ester carboxylesterase
MLIALALTLGVTPVAQNAAVAAPQPSYAKEFTQLRPQTSGVLYRQNSPGPNAAVGVILMHPNSNFENALACNELAARGFTALCLAGQYVNTNRENMVWEKLPLDVAPAVKFLREYPGIKKVVLVGHSGGGQLMPFYQNVAENGAAACQKPERIVKCSDELNGLPPADGVVLLDAHHGYGANTLTSLDGALKNERQPGKVDKHLDMYSPGNGYDPDGSEYSPTFRRAYLQAQAERMQRLTKSAQAAVDRVAHGRGQFPDAEQFPVFHTDARIWQCDVRLISHTKGKYPVLRGDGTTRVEVARTVRVPSCDPESNASFAGGAVQFTADAFLSSQTIRVTKDYDITEDDIKGIDWESSNTSTPANIEGVTVPLLIMAMTGHYWMVPSEIFYEHAGSTDKELSFVEGATHGFTPCKPCEKTPGQYGDTVKTTFDHVAGWLTDHYVS